MIFALVCLLGSGSGFDAAQAPRRRLAASQDATDSTPTAEPTRKYCNPSDISDALQGSFISEVAHAACPALRGEPQPSHCACAQVVVDTARFLEKLPAADCVFSDGNGGVLDAITEWAPLNLEKCAEEDFSTAGWGRAAGNGGVVGGPFMHYRVLDQGEIECPIGWTFLETEKECEEASKTHVAMNDGEWNGEQFSDSAQRLPFCFVGPYGGGNWNPNGDIGDGHPAQNGYAAKYWRVVLNGPTTWRPAINEVKFYADSGCTEEMTGFRGATQDDPAFLCSGAHNSGNKGCWNALDDSTTLRAVPMGAGFHGVDAWRPHCHDCAKSEVWLGVQFDDLAKVRCVVANNMGEGEGGGKSWNVGVMLQASNHNFGSDGDFANPDVWATVSTADQGNKASFDYPSSPASSTPAPTDTRLVCKRPVDLGYPLAAMPDYDYVYGTKGKLCEETTGANGDLVELETLTGYHECEDAYDALNAAHGRAHPGTAGWNAHSVYIPSGCSVNDGNGRHWNSQFATVFKTGGNARFDLTPICRRKKPVVDGAILIASGALGEKGCQSLSIGNHGNGKTLEECLGLCKADGAAFMQYHAGPGHYCSCWSSCERTRPASDFLSLADTYEIIWTESPTSDPTPAPTGQPTSDPTPAPTQPAPFSWGIFVEGGTHGSSVDPIYNNRQQVCPESYEVIDTAEACQNAVAWVQQGNLNPYLTARPQWGVSAFQYKGTVNHPAPQFGCVADNMHAGFGVYFSSRRSDKTTKRHIICKRAADQSK